MNRRQESWTHDTYFRAATNLCANITKEIRRQEDEFCSKNAVFEQKLELDRQQFLSRLHRHSYGNIHRDNGNGINTNNIGLRCAVEESLYQEDEEKYRIEYISDLQHELPLAFLNEEIELELKCNLQQLLRVKLCEIALVRGEEARISGKRRVATAYVSSFSTIASCKTCRPSIIKGEVIKPESEVAVEPSTTKIPCTAQISVSPVAAGHKVKVVQSSLSAASDGSIALNGSDHSGIPADCYHRGQEQPLGPGAIWVPLPIGTGPLAHYSTDAACGLFRGRTQFDRPNSAIRIKKTKSRRLEVTSEQSHKLASPKVVPSSHWASYKMETCCSGSLDKNQGILEAITVPAVMSSLSSPITRQRPFEKNVDENEGMKDLPKWLAKMMSTVSYARVSSLAQKFILKALQSEALHKCHSFACQKVLQRGKFNEIFTKCSTEEREIQMNGIQIEHKALASFSLRDKSVLPSDELSMCALAVEDAHSPNETKDNLHDWQHRFCELAREEKAYKKIISEELELVDHLLNGETYTHGPHYFDDIATKDGTVCVTCHRENGCMNVDGSAFSDGLAQPRLSNEESRKYLCKGDSLQRGAVDTEGQHTASSCGEDLRQLVEASANAFKKGVVWNQKEGDYVIIQLESEELNKDEPLLCHSHDHPISSSRNNVYEGNQELGWFRREVQRYLWPAKLEERIGHSLHGYVCPSNKSWCPTILRTGSTNVNCKQKFGADTLPKMPATHTKIRVSLENNHHGESVGWETDARSECVGIRSQPSQTHEVELDKLLSNVSCVVPKLPWRGSRAILSIRGAGDLMVSEVTFSTF